MGILSSIKKAVATVTKPIVSTIKKVAVPVVKAVTKPAVIVAAAGSSPVKFIKNPQQAVLAFSQKPIGEQVIKGAAVGAAIGVGTSIVMGAVTKTALTGLPAVVAKAATTSAGVVKTAATAHPLIAGGAILAAPAAIITVAKSPKLQEKILNIPSAYVETSVAVGTEAAKAAEGSYTLDDGIDFLKAHPYLTAVTAAAALGAAGFATAKVASIIAAYYQTSAAKKYLEEGTPVSTGNEGVGLPVGTNEGLPLTNQTTTITTGRRRRRKAKAEIIPSMRQTVNVSIGNRLIVANKRYLNARVLA
jgi:hypothetical protein